MNNHFNVKLINFGLNFAVENCLLRVSDLKFPETPIPIVFQQDFKSWLMEPETNDLGSANLYTENFNLYADCYFNKRVMLSQQSHDNIIIRCPNGMYFSFRSMSILLDHMRVEKSTQNELMPLRITTGRIKNLSFVPTHADPGIFTFFEPPAGLKKEDYTPEQAYIFTGSVINKFILD